MNNEARDAYPKGFLIGLIVVSTLGLLCGYESLCWGVRSKTAQLHEELSASASAITRQINIARIKALSFSEADLERAEFLRLSAQWQAYARITRYCAVYGVAKRNGGIVFGPGNLRGDDSRPVPPGRIYKNPPAGMVEAFKTCQPQIAGPYEEGGKRLVSAWTPVIDPRSDEVLMVMVVSVDASVWNRQYAWVWRAMALFAAPLVLCIGAALLLVRRNSRIPFSMLVPIEVCLTLVLGLIFTVTFWRMTRSLERHSRLVNFQILARSEAREVSEQLASLRTRAGTLALVLGGESDVNMENFVRYSAPSVQLSYAEMWAWVPVVPAAERDPFEARMRRAGLCGFSLWQHNVQGERCPVAKRDVYYPVLYCEPKTVENSLCGLDCGSDPDLSEALQIALRTGLITGTTPVLTPSKKNARPKLYVFEPVYVSGVNSRTLNGCILVVLDWEKVLRHAFIPPIMPRIRCVWARQPCGSEDC